MSEADAHIQDADILKMSKQETNEAGRIQFSADLPSGRSIHSEWFDSGKRREAMQAWLGAVRSEIVADEEEAKLRARRKALEERAAAATSDSPSSVPSAATPASLSTAIRPSTPAVPELRAVPSALSSDPNVFVRQAVVSAEQAVAYWRAESAKAIAELQAAEAALKKWRAIALSLGVSTGEDPAPSGADRSGEPAGGIFAMASADAE